LNLFSLGVTAEALRANIGSKSAISVQRGLIDPKFQVEGVASNQPFFFSENYANVLSYGIKIWTALVSVLSQCTRLTDRRTDRRTVFLRIRMVGGSDPFDMKFWVIRPRQSEIADFEPIFARSASAVTTSEKKV